MHSLNSSSSLNEAYDTLKRTIIKLAIDNEDSYNLSEILKKPIFQNIVNCPREYENINNIGDLVGVLELRAALHSKNVFMLRILSARIILASTAETKLRMRRLEHLIDDYEMHHIKTKVCSMCGRTYDENHLKSSSIVINVKPVDSPVPYQGHFTKEEANNNLLQCQRIQLWQQIAGVCDWDVLRHLPGMKEGDLNQIRKKYREDSLESRQECFEFWLNEYRYRTNSVTATIMKALLDTGHSEVLAEVNLI